MLNGEGNENGIKINRSNYPPKKKIGGAAHFFLIISKKKNKFVRATRFLSFFAVVLHNYNAAL